MDENTSTKAEATVSTRTQAPSAPSANTSAAQLVSIPTEPLPQDIDQHVAADDDDNDSAYGSSLHSDTTSVTSSIYRGYLENGRRYQTLKEDGYYMAIDERQADVIKAGHMVFRVLDSQEENPLFRSPVSDKIQNVLDVGTGDASWAIDVADNFPNLNVLGVDLHPPSETSLPPNCTLEVNDITRPWIFHEKFDLVHIRLLMGGCSDTEWKRLFKEAYDNLQPGGWIEQMEVSIDILCDDSTMPADSALAGLSKIFHQCTGANGKTFDDLPTMRSRIEDAGFINVHQKQYKMPIGPWPKHPVYKDAGRITKEVWSGGLEGYMLYLLTRFGKPEPWSPEECQVWFAKLRNELNKNWHIYQKGFRVWAQKPFDEPKVESQVEVKSLE